MYLLSAVAAAATLVVLETSLPDRLLPLHDPEGVNRRLQSLVYERLFYRTAITSEAKSRVVTRYDWLDGPVLALTPRAGLVWHDGEPFDAADICFTIDALRLGPTPRGDRAARHLTGCEVHDGVAHVSFTHRLHDARDLLFVPVLPAHRFDGPTPGPDHLEWRKPVGLGAFAVTSWTDEELVLRAAPSSIHGPRLDVLRVRAEGPDAVEQLLAGEVHVVVDVPLPQRPLVAASPHALRVRDPRQWWYVAVDTQHPWLSQLEARQALDTVLDREALRQTSCGHDPADRLPACELISGPQLPSSPDYDRRLRVDDGAAAGRRVATPPTTPLRLGYDAGIERAAPGLVAGLVAQWTAAGVPVVAEAVPSEAWSARRDRYDLVVDRWRADASDDLQPLLGTGGRHNVHGWSDPRTDELLATWAVAERDTDARDAAHALHAHLAEQRPLLYLFDLDGRSGMAASLRNTAIAPAEYYTDVDGWELRP